jgi:hypothetical protein
VQETEEINFKKIARKFFIENMEHGVLGPHLEVTEAQDEAHGGA